MALGKMMLNGKVAIVTGGTRGIGFAIVEKFLEQGAKVALLGTKKETVDRAIARLKEKNPQYEVIGFHPDLKKPEEVMQTFEQANKTFGRLDILANNAGVSANDNLYLYRVEDFDSSIDLNLTSVFVCAQAAAKIMKEQGGGVIINTSPMFNINGQASGVAYPASKSTVNGLTKSLARELGKDNIRVNAVAPAITRTEATVAVVDDVVEPLLKQIPLGRIGKPDDIATAYAFLASDYASYITGAILPVEAAAMA
jgi:3-oxoacyl-[acyl-carrier protein] reductase/7-alpha-hydroxysteroid dehydrogenase